MLTEILSIIGSSEWINTSQLFELLIRFGFNAIICSIIITLYYNFSKNKEYLFTFFAFNTSIFFMVYMMNSVDLGVGFGFGLFAVFSILRYRTTTVQIKEMTYLFMVITIAVINAIITDKFSYAELIFVNIILVILTYILEKLMRRQTLSVYNIVYEKIENITPEKREVLEDDLRERTGLNIIGIKIVNIDFLRDVANIKLYYKAEEEDFS